MSNRRRAGFTLLEIIVIVVLLGIVAAFFIVFMGEKITGAPEAVLEAEREANVEQVLERIIADYREEINGANPDAALTTVSSRESTYEALDPSGAVDVEFEYITFDASGNEVPGAASDPNLKVTVYADPDGGGAERHRLVTLLTQARTTAGGEAVVPF